MTATTTPIPQRLADAIKAGVVCVDQRVATDVNGATYVEHRGHLKVSGKYANADLKRLGY